MSPRHRRTKQRHKRRPVARPCATKSTLERRTATVVRHSLYCCNRIPHLAKASLLAATLAADSLLPALAEWSFAGSDPEWRPTFPDWDCNENEYWNGFYGELNNNGLLIRNADELYQNPKLEFDPGIMDTSMQHLKEVLDMFWPLFVKATSSSTDSTAPLDENSVADEQTGGGAVDQSLFRLESCPLGVLSYQLFRILHLVITEKGKKVNLISGKKTSTPSTTMKMEPDQDQESIAFSADGEAEINPDFDPSPPSSKSAPASTTLQESQKVETDRTPLSSNSAVFRDKCRRILEAIVEATNTFFMQDGEDTSDQFTRTDFAAARRWADQVYYLFQSEILSQQALRASAAEFDRLTAKILRQNRLLEQGSSDGTSGSGKGEQQAETTDEEVYSTRLHTAHEEVTWPTVAYHTKVEHLRADLHLSVHEILFVFLRSLKELFGTEYLKVELLLGTRWPVLELLGALERIPKIMGEREGEEAVTAKGPAQEGFAVMSSSSDKDLQVQLAASPPPCPVDYVLNWPKLRESLSELSPLLYPEVLTRSERGGLGSWAFAKQLEEKDFPTLPENSKRHLVQNLLRFYEDSFGGTFGGEAEEQDPGQQHDSELPDHHRFLPPEVQFFFLTDALCDVPVLLPKMILSAMQVAPTSEPSDAVANRVGIQWLAEMREALFLFGDIVPEGGGGPNATTSATFSSCPADLAQLIERAKALAAARDERTEEHPATSSAAQQEEFSRALQFEMYRKHILATKLTAPDGENHPEGNYVEGGNDNDGHDQVISPSKKVHVIHDSAISFLFTDFFGRGWEMAELICLHGTLLLDVYKYQVCARQASQCLEHYQKHLELALFENFQWEQHLRGNPFPVFTFLDRLRPALIRHDFKDVDFSWKELDPRGVQLLSEDLPTADVASTSQELALSEPLSQLLAAWKNKQTSEVRGATTKAGTSTTTAGSSKKAVVYATMVFGSFFNQWISAFVYMSAYAKMQTLVLLCLDEEAHKKCVTTGSDVKKEHNFDLLCLQGRKKTILHKFTLPLILLNWLPAGIDVFWLDFDVFVMQNPLKSLENRVEQLEVDDTNDQDKKPVELLVSASFGDDCICTGLVFFRNTKTVKNWLWFLLGYLYEHVHLHDQQFFSMFLSPREDVEKLVGFEKASADKLLVKYLLPRLEVPKWGILDPVTEFATAAELESTGWSGELKNVVMFHFLQGDSEINESHGEREYVAKARLEEKKKSPMEEFFGPGSFDPVSKTFNWTRYAMQIFLGGLDERCKLVMLFFSYTKICHARETEDFNFSCCLGILSICTKPRSHHYNL
ncbi:unnamed protein product [Amoebophrya sp. A120]|nr:unnamed protein product [Amoebophrya sp. A120]|eukprot:GSA120T00001107001.1